VSSEHPRLHILTISLQESMNTILALVQAEKEGQIESKMLKARQLEEIREARRVEAEKKEEEKKAKLEDVKDGLRKKRKRASASKFADKEESLHELTVAGTKATKAKKKVAFA
jgi:60S ribosomal subunit assembly/export protein LOC1